MNEKLYELGDLEIWKKGDRFFVRYDAGAHQIVMREDEISEEDAINAAKSKDAAIQMLFALQKRLIQAGVDPYLSNTK
jgi:hypothetical protein